MLSCRNTESAHVEIKVGRTHDLDSKDVTILMKNVIPHLLQKGM